MYNLGYEIYSSNIIHANSIFFLRQIRWLRCPKRHRGTWIQGDDIGAAVSDYELEHLGAAGVGRGGSGAGLRGERVGP